MSFGKFFFVFMWFYLFNSAKGDNSQVLRFDAANISILRDTKTGFGLAKFIKIVNKTLNIPPFKILHVKTYKVCLVDCAADQLCISFNLYKTPNSQGLYRCGMLPKDVLNNTENFQNDTDYNHFTRKTECFAKPCKNNGICVPVYNNNSIICKCPQFISGNFCEKVCHGKFEPLGMNDFRINNSQITASTYYNLDTAPWNGRLNTELGSKGWASQIKDVGQYLQIDLGKDKMISKVATQGRGHPGAIPETNQYVTEYSLQYSGNNLHWMDYKTNGTKKIFPGNNDMNTVVLHTLSQRFVARYVRFVVEAYNYWPAMRVELYGCG